MARAGREHLQALTRGLDALALMNRVGVGTNGMLAKELGLKHSTAHRILMVLTDLGLLRHDPLGHQFVLASGVRKLGADLREPALIDAVAVPRMQAWTRRHGLPLLLVTEDDGVLSVRASTDAHWPLAAARIVPGSILPAEDSGEAEIFRAQPRATPAVRTRTRAGETQLSAPVMVGGVVVACLSLRGPSGSSAAPAFARRWSKPLGTLAADIAAAAA